MASKSNIYPRSSSLFSSKLPKHNSNITLNSTPKVSPRLSSLFSSKLPEHNGNITPKSPPKSTPKSPPKSPPKSRKTVQQEINELLKEKDSHVLAEKFKYLSQFSYFRTNCIPLYKMTIHRLSVAKKFDLIEEALESQKKYLHSEGFCTRLIHLYGKCGMFDHAYKMFDEMPKRKCKQGVKSFQALLGAAANSEKYDKVFELFRELPGRMSIVLDVGCYNTTMHALCKKGLVEDAVVLLDVMEESGLKPDLLSYNLLLCAYYEGGNCMEGDKLWERMIKSNVVPNVLSYNFKLKGLVNDGKLLEAIELAIELKGMELKPNASTFNAVIEGLVKDDDLVGAKDWYHKLLESGCRPDKNTFGTLVPYFCEKGEYELAFELCEIALKGRTCSADETVLQNVVDVLAKNSMTDKAKVLVELGLSNSYSPYHLTVPESVSLPLS